MKTVITDQRIDKECTASLARFGYEIIKLPPSKHLAAPVASHPDMLIFIDGQRLITHEKYYAEAKETVDLIVNVGGFSLALSNEEWGEKYPSDVLFNAAAAGDRLICREASTSVLIKNGKRLINVNQGYAKCSTVTVGGGIITADMSIARAAALADIDTLLLCGSHTRLSGYDCGFIGGASGDDGERVFFCGDITKHPQYSEISEFCKNHGRQAVSLSSAPLYDYGSLIFI